MPFIIVFRFIIIIIMITITQFSHIQILNCCPLEFFMDKDIINDRTYFYYDDRKIEIQKQIIEHELNILLNNFDLVTFDLIRFIKNNNRFFYFNHPNNHPNFLLKLPNQYFQYYYSFPFTHNNSVNFNYYEIISSVDLNGNNREQY